MKQLLPVAAVVAVVASDTLVFRVTGAGDSYAGSLGAAAVTTAVPEPSTYAMMFLGLGLIGASLRGRRGAR